jgi:hypothetical protein
MRTALILLTSAVLLCACEPTLLLFTGEKPARFEVQGDTSYVNGVLGKKAYKNFLKMTAEHPTLKTLVLQSVPGSMNDEYNVKTTKLVHDLGMNTAVQSTSDVASGEVDLFIAGNKRSIAQGAKIGVHSWSDGNKDGIEYPVDDEAHQLFIDFFDAIEMDTAFYWYTVRAAAAADIHYMSQEEIEKYKLEKH